jgi:hypothetical protein
MKLLTRSLSLLTVASLVLFFASCGGDGGEKATKEKAQLKKLSKTWELVSVTLEDVVGQPEQIGDDFTLTIGGSYDSESPEGPYTYAVSDTDAPSPWKATGTWEFVSIGSNDSGTILRDDDVTMTYTINSNGQLTLMFNFDGDGHSGTGRKMEVSGNWTFVLE